MTQYNSLNVKLSNSQLNRLKSAIVKPLGMLGLTAAASATDAAIIKKLLRSGGHTTLIISNDDMQDLLKIVKSLEDSGILLDGITETVKNEAKEQKGGAGRGVIGAGERTIRAGYGSKKF